MINTLEIAISALKEIKETQGRVCNVFELCDHKACRSSYSSWAIADKALKDIESLSGEDVEKEGKWGLCQQR